MNVDAALRDLEHADPRVRAQAADALGRVDDPDRTAAIRALVRACDDAHAAVRYAALLSLGELAADSTVEAVAARLSDGEPLVREAATIALGQVGSAPGAAIEVAWSALAEALRVGAPEVRFQAVASLVEISPARAVPLVLAALDDQDHKVRAQAAAALGDAGDPSVAEALTALLDDADDVRYEAALALVRLGDRRGVPFLIRALGSSERALDAATALAALGLDGDPAMTAALAREVGRFFGDPLVKVRAAEALARAGDPSGRAHLDKAARSRRDDVRGLAQSVLETLK